MISFCNNRDLSINECHMTSRSVVFTQMEWKYLAGATRATSFSGALKNVLASFH